MLALSLPAATAHSLIVLSPLAEASVLPSGLYAMDDTPSVCPLRVAFCLPVATSHSLIVLSLLAEASVLPSGLKATDDTPSVCPLRVSRRVRSSAVTCDNGSRPRQPTPSHTITCRIRPPFVFIADLPLPLLPS